MRSQDERLHQMILRKNSYRNTFEIGELSIKELLAIQVATESAAQFTEPGEHKTTFNRISSEIKEYLE